jgi:hypothetical protein
MAIELMCVEIWQRGVLVLGGKCSCAFAYDTRAVWACTSTSHLYLNI